jgi:hypothetical protein
MRGKAESTRLEIKISKQDYASLRKGLTRYRIISRRVGDVLGKDDSESAEQRVSARLFHLER